MFLKLEVSNSLWKTDTFRIRSVQVIVNTDVFEIRGGKIIVKTTRFEIRGVKSIRKTDTFQTRGVDITVKTDVVECRGVKKNVKTMYVLHIWNTIHRFMTYILYIGLENQHLCRVFHAFGLRSSISNVIKKIWVP